MRHLVIPAILLVCLSSVCCRPAVVYAPAASPGLTDEGRAARAEDMSVAIMAEDDGHATCGGVWVGPDTILTAFHCVKHNGEPILANEGLADLLRALGVGNAPPPWDPTGHMAHYRVRSSSSDSPEVAVIQRIDRDDDLALLYAPAPPMHQVSQLAVGDIPVGESLDVVGSTVGWAFTFSRCFVAGSHDAGEGGDNSEKAFKTLQVSGPVYLGNSGGGAFDPAGHLVGIADFMVGVSASRGPVPDVSFFVHRDVLRSFLKV